MNFYHHPSTGSCVSNGLSEKKTDAEMGGGRAISLICTIYITYICIPLADNCKYLKEGVKPYKI